MIIAGIRCRLRHLADKAWMLWLAAFLLVTLAGYHLLPGAGAGFGKGGGAGAGELAQADTGLATPVVPAPEPLLFKAADPLEAVAMNAAVSVSNLPNPAAAGFNALFPTKDDRLHSLECLTAAIYYEAAIEPTDGQRAVAQVVLNRVRHPAFPKSVCGVVFQGSERSTGCQFTFTCDGSMRREPSAAGWRRARQIAEAALDGNVFAPVGHATHYHTNWVVPYWRTSLDKVANVGSHIFYRWQGGWGRPAAFRSRLTMSEPNISFAQRVAALTSALEEEVTEIVLVDPGSFEAAGLQMPEPEAPAAPAKDIRGIGADLSSGNAAATASALPPLRRFGVLKSADSRSGQRMEPDSKRAGCRHAPMAATAGNTSAPPPC